MENTNFNQQLANTIAEFLAYQEANNDEASEFAYPYPMDIVGLLSWLADVKGVTPESEA
jgi:hypothetical protein